MNMKFQPLKHTDYRQLLREALKFRGYSYRSFSLKHSDIVSFGMLGAALSKGRGGLVNKPSRTFSAETVTRIGKALKLTDDELFHLILLKTENDAEVLPGLYGSLFSDLMKKVVAEQRERLETKATKVKREQYSHSSIACATAQLIDALPDHSKGKVVSEILPAAKAVLARQRKKPGVRTLALNLNRLEELTR
jgi:hypothetical protein